MEEVSFSVYQAPSIHRVGTEPVRAEDPALNEFIAETPDGRRINYNIGMLHEFARGITAYYMNYTMIEPFPRSPKEFIGWAQQNGLSVDFDRLSNEARDYRSHKSYAQETVEFLDRLRVGQVDLARQLLDNPELRLGNRVVVLRSPTTAYPLGYYEPGWTISDITADGRLVLAGQKADGRPATKPATPTLLLQWRDAYTTAR